ncbi:MAG: ATPase domain-containing protein, partial [Patescibacteria group bacterium]
MGKGSSTVWECQNCGAQFPKWTGQCPECQKWNSLVETVVSANEGKRNKEEGRRRAGSKASKPQKLSEILKDIDATGQRIGTGIAELDRVLGGGLVPGEVVLLAGEPGMGKSTLLSRVALAINQPVLYVCGEESPSQVALRLQRLSKVGKSDLSLLSETNVDAVVAEIERPGPAAAGPALVIVDSIQTLTTDDLTG